MKLLTFKKYTSKDNKYGRKEVEKSCSCFKKDNQRRKTLKLFNRSKLSS